MDKDISFCHLLALSLSLSLDCHFLRCSEIALQSFNRLTLQFGGVLCACARHIVSHFKTFGPTMGLCSEFTIWQWHVLSSLLSLSLSVCSLFIRDTNLKPQEHIFHSQTFNNLSICLKKNIIGFFIRLQYLAMIASHSLRHPLLPRTENTDWERACSKCVHVARRLPITMRSVPSAQLYFQCTPAHTQTIKCEWGARQHGHVCPFCCSAFSLKCHLRLRRATSDNLKVLLGSSLEHSMKWTSNLSHDHLNERKWVFEIVRTFDRCANIFREKRIANKKTMNSKRNSVNGVHGTLARDGSEV